jgi:hypothetical protein
MKRTLIASLAPSLRSPRSRFGVRRSAFGVFSLLFLSSFVIRHSSLADVSAVRYDLSTNAIILDPDGAQFINYSQTQFKIGGTQLVATGKTPSFANTITIAGTDGKTLTLNQNLTLTGTTGKTLTLTGGLTIGADTSITGGGTLALGGFTFTVPATGTAVLLAANNIFTGNNSFSGSGPIISFVDSGGVTSSFGSVSGFTGFSGNRNFATGAIYDTGKASASAYVFTGSGSSYVGWATNQTNNTAPTERMRLTNGLGLNTTTDPGLGNLAAEGIIANSTTFNLINTVATTVNLAGAATTFTLGATTGTMTLRNATVNHAGTLVAPVTGYNTDLGQLSKKYKALYASELWVETLVAQNTVATIGGRILVGPTTTLIADLSTGATTIDVKHNQISSGDRVYLEANGSVEFLAITSAPTTITGGYRYSVTRDLDGTGANAWSAGDAVFNTGTTGNGFIDIYSVQAVKGGSQLGPTIVGNVRNSATYNDWTENWAIGNLVGLYGYGSTTYGVGLGPYSSGKTNVTVDATNGLRIRNFTTVLGQWDVSGNITVGDTAATKPNILITVGGAVNLRTGTTAALALDSTNGLRIFNSGGSTIGQWDTSGNILIGQTGASQSNVYLTSGAVKLRNNTTDYISLDSSGNALFGLTTSSQGNVSISGGTVSIRRGTTDYITLNATDAQFTNLIKMTGASAAIALGTTPPTSATVGTGIWLDRTGLYALSANTQNTVLDSNGITAGAGQLTINSTGLTFVTPATAYVTTNSILWMDSNKRTGAITNSHASGTSTGYLEAKSEVTGDTAVLNLLAVNDLGVATGITITRTPRSGTNKGYLNLGGATGWVTIGDATAVPTHVLDVYGTGWFNGQVTIDSGATNQPLILATSTGVNSNQVFMINSAKLVYAGAISSDGRWRLLNSDANGNAETFSVSQTGAGTLSAQLILNQIAAPAAVTDSAILFAQDVGGTAEMKVKDEAGNVTQISPHATDSPGLAIDDGTSDAMPVVIHHSNDYLGTEEWIHVSALARAVEKLTGQKFVFSRPLPAKRDWLADQDRAKQARSAELAAWQQQKDAATKAHTAWSKLPPADRARIVEPSFESPKPAPFTKKPVPPSLQNRIDSAKR